MGGGMKLSDHPRLVVGARISKSGSAMPQPGDLEGLSAPVKAGDTGITVIIGTEIR
jgi:cytochrome c-type biogenesis protein CcmH